MAITFGWQGAADTDVDFTEFYGADHTLLAWFLLQYPRSYAGPIFAVNGTGTFAVGQGDFNRLGSTGQAHLAARIEGASGAFAPAALDAGRWYLLALVRSGGQYRLLLDGQPLGSPLVLTGTDRPAGRLRLGRPSPGTGVDGQEAQFYGMLDEVAVFTRALPDSDIQARYANRTRLTGTEANLLAGWVFSPAPGTPPAPLRRPVTRSGQTAVVPTTWTADDLRAIPLPRHEPMELPFVAGDAWTCAQGTAAAFSHRGYAAFCWDFLIADKGVAWTDVYPNGSFEAPVVGAGPGDVVTVSDVSPPADTTKPETENQVIVRHGDGIHRAYLHLLKGSAQVRVGDRTRFALPIAKICTEWRAANRPVPHLHFATQPDPADMVGFVTVPTAFSNYDVRNSDSTWSFVPLGIPQQGQVVRRRKPASPRVAPGTPVGVVSRGPDKLDVFVTDRNGVIQTAAWQPDYHDWWHGWWELNGGRGRAGAPVHAVSRSRDKLDVFVTGTDGRVYTAAWEPAFTDWWHGWWVLNDGRAALGAHVTAVSRGPDKLDVFVVGTDGRVYTAAWQPTYPEGWRGWWRIGTAQVPQGSMVTAVSRGPDKLDVFVTDVNGDVLTAAWQSGDTAWRGWWRLNGGRARPGAPVTAVSRGRDKLDVFVVGTDEGVWTAAWQPAFTDGWHGWWRIGALRVPQGSPVHAVSRGPDQLDVFATDVNGVIQTAAWEPAFTDGWHGWWQIGNGRAAPGAPVTAVSRSWDKLDVFVAGTDARVWTAAWEPATQWRGWWPMGD